MKTLLFTLEYPPFKGGVANVYGNLVEHWPDKDIQVLSDDRHQLVKAWLRPRWLAALFRLDRAVGKHKIKHVLVGHILPLGWVAYLVSHWQRSMRYSVFLHGMDFEYAHKTSRKARQARKILGRCARIFCSNSYLAGRVKERYPDLAAKVAVVTPGVAPDRHYDQAKIDAAKTRYGLNNKIVFLSLGRLVKRKGVDIALQAFRDIVKRAPNAYYVIAGDGPDKEYLSSIAKGIPNVIFITNADEDMKWSLLNLCDIFIMPSRDIDGDYEGFGIVYLEAAVCGKPVIAGDSGGIRDAVAGAYTGIMIDGTSLERVTGAMLALLQDKDLRNKMGEAGRKRAVEEFGWEGKVGIIYDKICNIEIGKLGN